MRLREEDELFGVVLHLVVGDHEAEVVEQEELKLELVELGLGETADLMDEDIKLERIGRKGWLDAEWMK